MCIETKASKVQVVTSGDRGVMPGRARSRRKHTQQSETAKRLTWESYQLSIAAEQIIPQLSGLEQQMYIFL